MCELELEMKVERKRKREREGGERRGGMMLERPELLSPKACFCSSSFYPVHCLCLLELVFITANCILDGMLASGRRPVNVCLGFAATCLEVC